MKTPLYERTSTPRDADALEPALRDAVTAHAEANQLGDVLGSVLEGCDTRSVRLHRKGLLSRITGTGDPDTEHRTIALVTPRYLVVAVVGEKRGTHVRSARLDAVSLSGPETAVLFGSGVTVTGVWSGEVHAAGFHVALGDDESGRAFRARLTSAVTDAKSR